MIDLTIEQILTDEVVRVTRSQTLVEAGERMSRAAIKSVVVTDDARRPVGILTSTDFVRMAADGEPPASVTVAEYMTEDIVTVTGETAVHEAADLMRENGISHLPVVDGNGRLTGIVTTTDIAGYVAGADSLLEHG